MEKGKLFNIFKYFKKHEIGLMQKVISSVIVFFILINLINIRGIGVDVDFLNGSVMVSKKMVVGQVRYMTAFSVEILTRMFVVDKNEGEGIIDKRARAEVEEIIALELAKIANRYEEGARGDKRGERAGDGNSLMASIGYLMATDIYEKDGVIKGEERDSDSFMGEIGIIKRWEDVGDKLDIKCVRDSILMGEIIKEKEGELLLAKELSNIDLWNKDGIIKEEGIENKMRLSLLK